jgi:hypothetical protein
METQINLPHPESPVEPIPSPTTPAMVYQVIIFKYLNRLIWLAVTLIGLNGLYQEVIQVLFKYPQIFSQFTQNSDTQTSIYFIQQLLFTSSSNFVSTAYGLTMLIKPSHLTKAINYLIAGGLLIVSHYFNTRYQITPEIITNLYTVVQ